MPKPNPITVKIKKYQSIDDLEFKIHGFTCITGHTNIGKSAIVRAISSAIMNNPVVGMVRKGAKFSTVEIESDSWSFKWEKGERDVNRYTIDEKIYDKTGQVQLPELVQMGFSSINIGKDSLQPWFAAQFFPIFLLDKSGPQITDFISDVSRLNVIQDAIVLSSRDRKKKLDRLKSIQDSQKSVKDKLGALSGLSNMKQLWQDIEDQKLSIEEYEEKLKLMSNFSKEILAHSNKISSFSDVSDVHSKVEYAGVMLDSIEYTAKSVNNMMQFIEILKNHAKKIIVFREIGNVKEISIDDTEFNKFKEMMKFTHIDELKKSVSSMSGVDKVSVPELESLNEQLKSLDSMCKHFDAVKSAKSRIVDFADPKIPDVNVSDEVENIRLAELANGKMYQYAQEVIKLREELKTIECSISDVESEINKIPLCPTCGTVVQVGHKEEQPDHFADDFEF